MIPDCERIARYEQGPERGPRMLFFSGGTALNALSRRLIRYTHNSIHIVTPFDSGGSSAKLREAFRMPAVGDLRSRILALADPSVKGNSEVVRLLAYRFPAAERGELLEHLDGLQAGTDPLIREISQPTRDLIGNYLGEFRRHMPADFDLRGASVGNLMLVGGYLNNHRGLDPVISLFSRLVEARGTVVPVSSEVLHLGAELDNGRRVIGQHRITGKDCPPIASPIRRIFLCRVEPPQEEVEVESTPEILDLIRKADLIVFPMGSFFSSVLVNLLPKGIAEAVANQRCPKVYVPNTGCDPEQFGLSVFDCYERLATALGGAGVPGLVLINSRSTVWAEPMERNRWNEAGVRVLDTDLVSTRTAPYIDEERLVPALLSLV